MSEWEEKKLLRIKTVEKTFFLMKKALMNVDNIKQLNIHVIGVHEEEGNNSQKFSKMNDNYEIVHLSSSVKTNLKKHE